MNIDKRSNRRALLKGLLPLCLLVLVPVLPASAQENWPNRPVRIVVPFSPGGSTDVVARAVAKDLAQTWGQPVVVENRAGASGNIGAEVVAHAALDGYTLFMASGSILTVNPHLYSKLPFDVKKDFIAVTNVASGPQVVAVHPSVPAKNIQEFLAFAKSHPGKLNFGSAGVGSQVHMAAESFLDAAGINAEHIPYKGEGPSYADLMAGQIQLMVGNIAAGVPLVKDGRIRALAVTSKTRSPMLPDVPTVAESGIPGFENEGWFGFMVPAGTDKRIVDRIYRETVKVLGSKEMKARLYAQGMAPVGNSPDEFAKAIDDESARWAQVIERRKLRVD